MSSVATVHVTVCTRRRCGHEGGAHSEAGGTQRSPSGSGNEESDPQELNKDGAQDNAQPVEEAAHPKGSGVGERGQHYEEDEDHHERGVVASPLVLDLCTSTRTRTRNMTMQKRHTMYVLYSESLIPINEQSDPYAFGSLCFCSCTIDTTTTLSHVALEVRTLQLRFEMRTVTKYHMNYELQNANVCNSHFAGSPQQVDHLRVCIL